MSINSPFKRRFQETKSKRIVLAAVAAAALALSACSAGAGEPAAESGQLQQASIQLGWVPNVESMAPIVAQAKGYYEEEGLEVKLLPGGPDVVADAQIVSGNALMGILNSETLANAVKGGAPLVAVGATYQTSSSAIVTLADSGITEPSDLEGKRFGFAQTDERVYKPFFKMAGVDIDKIELVTTGADPASLVSGEVDAMSGTLPNQPIAIQSQGLKTREIRLSDYGYNRWSGLLVVRADSLENPEKRSAIEAILKATHRALENAVKDPETAGQTVYDVYGEQLGLKLEPQIAGAKVWAGLASESSELLQVTNEGVASQQKFFDSIGLQADASKMFDLSVGERVFNDGSN
ncbi:ABC transporter substrate-binding protein [Arthrobacter sp. 9AX]|uniref:ABC transporter substrate-binding protein n=1 Tax=Arthrobacter sp. 9AX TaxID=2653131 RepID=UPI00135AB16B|nr:ABC transporter substrate-binding protein [Arthrobacter sp. 9AX]